MSADQHVLDLLPAYALDCLDEDEAIYVSEHLATCPRCNSELKVYQEIADSLPLAAPMVHPPASVKRKLMERIRSDSLGLKTQSLRPKSRNLLSGLFQRVPPGLALASLVIIIALISTNILLWNRVSRLNPASPQTAMSIISLQGTQNMPDATGLIVISQDGDHGTLVVDHLQPLSQTEQYQLWLIVNGNRTNGGVFSVDNAGYGSLWVNSPRPLKDYASFGVTIEPSGGSPSPTGEKVLGGDL
jgi:anti-sigma-K factor RskA